MDKIIDTSETRDFMNVDSFSQLPFIRPAPLPSKETAKGGGAIRLFGKEFGSSDNDNSDIDHGGDEDATKDMINVNNSDTSSRKFECHYCCRNFPTSQALGGHQNAHKRERQHAKRAHLHSAMAHGAHIYGLVNYSRLTTPVTYPSWSNNNSNGYTSQYGQVGSHGSYNGSHPTINGSPLGLWRVPSGNNSASVASFSSHQQIPLQASSNPNSHNRLSYYESKPSMQDHVSLDLHL